MARKTSVDFDDPDRDDVLVSLMAAKMLTSATVLLLEARGENRGDWSELIMRAMMFMLDRGEEHAGLDHPSVLRLRDFCNEHLAGPQTGSLS
jgi:hypothetical protein